MTAPRMNGFALEFDRLLPHPVERVWWALTDRDALAAWFMATDFAAVVGHRFTIRGTPEPGWRGWTDCQVLALEPPRRMVWSFLSTPTGAPTRVVFALEPAGDGTRLTLRHDGETDGATEGLLRAGWAFFLDRLPALLDTPAPG